MHLRAPLEIHQSLGKASNSTPLELSKAESLQTLYADHETPQTTWFFDVDERTAKLAQMGDPLVGLKARIDWEAFRSDLTRVYD